MTRAKVALVTGTSSGFGLYTAIALARRGFRVYASMRDTARRDALDDAASEAGVSVDLVALDVREQRSVDEAIARIHRASGGIDVLVNNAGIAVAGLFEDLSISEMSEQLETNVLGVMRTMQAVLPQMRARGRGRIVNVSSGGGKLPTPMLAGYCGSKAAVDALSEAVRLEVRRFGVHVSVVAPGTYKTDAFTRNRRVAARASDPASDFFEENQRLEAGVQRMLARNHADPREVAETVVRAATERQPATYYRVGSDVHFGAGMRAILPQRLYEWGIRRYFESLGRR